MSENLAQDIQRNRAAAAPANVPSPSLTEKAYRELEERIVTLALEPGEVLSEARLSTSLGIGRTPVREALQRLAREGLVVVLPRRGVLVSEFNVQSHLRMQEVRREIENLMARCAALRASAAERARFGDLAQEIRQAAASGDDLAFMRLDLEFNQRVAAAARNEFAVKAVELMAGLSRRFWFMHNQRGEDLHTTAEAHARVADAIARGDADGARRESDGLMDHIEHITRAAVDW